MAKNNLFIIGLREKYKKMLEPCELKHEEKEDVFQDADLLTELEEKFEELFGSLGEDENETLNKYTANYVEDDTA